MEKNYPKIAIISAFIGNGGQTGALSFTEAAQRDFEKYGIDVYSFTDKDLNLLELHVEPTIKKESIVSDRFIDRIRMKWYRQRYKQPIYPSEKDDYTRLVAKIPKILFYKVVPNEYDYYVWLDSKFTIQEHWVEYLFWLIDRYQGYNIITSKHCGRNSVREELAFLLEYRKKIEWCLPQKYNMAKIVWQYWAYRRNRWFKDEKLYELTMIVYSKSVLEKSAFCEEWYAHNCYYSIQDQISFPFLTQKHGIKVCALHQKVFDMPFTWHEYSSK